MEPDDIGYVRLTQFTEQADAGLKAAVKHAEAAGRRQADAR